MDHANSYVSDVLRANDDDRWDRQLEHRRIAAERADELPRPLRPASGWRVMFSRLRLAQAPRIAH